MGKPTCAIKGLKGTPQRGTLCLHVVTGGIECAYPGQCPHKRDPEPARAYCQGPCRREIVTESGQVCAACGGAGVQTYNPNLNPNSFEGTATAKCSRCQGTGMEDAEDESGQGRECGGSKP